MIIHREFLSREIAKNSVQRNSRPEIEKKSFKIDNCGQSGHVKRVKIFLPISLKDIFDRFWMRKKKVQFICLPLTKIINH